MIKRFNPDFSLSISHELAYMRETPEGGYVAHGDYATLFSELESVKAERDALAVENAALKDGFEWLYAIVSSDEVSIPDEKYSAVTNAAAVLSETPATDAAIAAIEARGAIAAIESLIGKKKRALAEMHPDTHAYGATEVIIRNQIRDLESFATELREAK